MTLRYNIRSRETGKWLAYFDYMDSIWYWRTGRDLKGKPTVRLVEYEAGEGLDKALREKLEYEAVLIEEVSVAKAKGPRAVKKLKETGTLYHDRDDGWYLEGEKPNSGSRIQDLFRDFNGQEIEITIKVVNQKAGRKG